MRYLKLYFRFVAVFLQGLMEYRLNFFLDFFALFVSNIVGYFSIWLIMNRFESIGGWTYYEVMFLASLYHIAFGVCGLFIRSPMQSIDLLVNRGRMDTLLTKPIPPLLHVIMMKFNHIWAASVFVGTAVIATCLRNLQIVLTPLNVVWLLFVLVSGVFLLSAIFILAGSLSFRFIQAATVASTIIYSIGEFVRYPITIYPTVIRILLTFLLPFAFINFYPSQYFLGRDSVELFHPLFQFGTPLVAAVMFLAAVTLWRHSLRHYSSTGS